MNCQNHFEQLKPLIKEVIVSHHFKRDLSDFDTNLITDCKHDQFTRLHKFEKTIHGHHLFRALKDKTHIAYVIDKDHRLIFLRAFKNYKEYGKFLSNDKNIMHVIENS